MFEEKESLKELEESESELELELESELDLRERLNLLDLAMLASRERKKDLRVLGQREFSRQFNNAPFPDRNFRPDRAPKTYQWDVWDRLKYKTSKSGHF